MVKVSLFLLMTKFLTKKEKAKQKIKQITPCKARASVAIHLS